MKEVEHTPTDQALRGRLHEAFRKQLPVPVTVESSLAGALLATLQHPGSLFRAELTFGIAAVYGLPAIDGERLAIALEYFHTASLIFDDLPSMDDATYRRGAICLHQLYGEGTAILAALALINRAYALSWQVMQAADPVNGRAAAEYLERYLGLCGILDGQSRDLHFGTKGADLYTSQQIALEKTASLIRLPMVLPAILGGAPAEQRHLLHRLAKFWGLSYQALDDLKDVLKGPQETGKTTRRDELLHRPNVALELGTEQAIARQRHLSGIARRLITRLERLNPELGLLQEVSARFDAETDATLEECPGIACCSSS